MIDVPYTLTLIGFHSLTICLVLSPMAAFWRWIHEQRVPWIPEIEWPILAVAISLIISCIGSINRTRSVTFLLGWMGLWGAFRLAVLLTERWLHGITTGSGILVAVLCLVEFVITRGRVGWLSNPNLIGSGLVLAIFAGWSNPVWWLGGLALLTTGSRGALLGALTALLAGFRLRARWIMVGMILTALLLISIRPATVRERLGTWSEAIGLFAQRPVAGWGIGVYPDLARNHPYSLHADSMLLTVAAETGIIGLAAWAWLLIAGARLAIHSHHPARLALLAWGVQQLVDHTLWYPWVGMAVMICLALIIGNQDG